MSGGLSAPNQQVKSSERLWTQDQANDKAIQISETELRRGHGVGGGRLLLKLTHMYGVPEDLARVAVKYISDLKRTNRLHATEGAETFEPAEGYEPVEPEETLTEADMKPEFGQMPPFTARTLEAAAQGSCGIEIQAALEIMARATAVSKVAEKGIKTVRDLMVDRGYDAHTTQNKAFYTTQFTKLDDDGHAHSFQMVGWHGTGRYVGGEKTILEFYDDDKDPKKPVVSIGVINEDNVNPAKQTEVVQHIVEYIKHNG